MIFAVASLFIILLLMLPKSDPEAQAKMASAAMLMCAKEYRQTVASWLSADDTKLAPFDNRCPATITSLQVDEAGVITLYNEAHGLRVVLTPQQQTSGLQWGCRGEPARLVTRLCKP